MGAQPHAGIPNPEQQRWGRKAQTASGGENQWGFSLPGRGGSLLETHTPYSQGQTLLLL